MATVSKPEQLPTSYKSAAAKSEFIKNPLNPSFKAWLLKHNANDNGLMLKLATEHAHKKYSRGGLVIIEPSEQTIKRENFEFPFFTIYANREYRQRGDTLLYDAWIAEREERLKKGKAVTARSKK